MKTIIEYSRGQAKWRVWQPFRLWPVQADLRGGASLLKRLGIDYLVTFKKLIYADEM